MLELPRALSTLLTLAVLAGCDRVRDPKKEEVRAQARADERIADERIADLRSASSQDLLAAQASDDAHRAAAQARLDTAREAYRQEASRALAALDERVADLELRAATLSGEAQEAVRAKLRLIQVSRATYLDDYGRLDAANSATWDTTKAQLDREWAELNALIDAP